jgi:hypothetical protein
MVKEDLSKNIVIPVWGVMIMVTIFIALFGFVYRISVFQGQTFEQIRQVRADIDYERIITRSSITDLRNTKADRREVEPKKDE